MSMILFWSVVLGLVSMIAFAVTNALSKPLLHETGPARLLFTRGVITLVALGVAAIPHYHLISEHWTAALLTVALGVAGYLPVLAFMVGIRESRLGIVAPIAATAPLFTVLFSFLFLGVDVAPTAWFAIALVIAANVFVAVDFADWRDSQVLKRSSGVPFALAASLGWGIFFFLLIPSVRALGPWLAPLLAEVGVVFAAGVHAAISRQSLNLRMSLRPAIAANGFLVAVAIAAFTYGVENFNVAVVAALSNSTAIVSTALGALLFKERLYFKEKVAGAIMIAGVCVLSIPA